MSTETPQGSRTKMPKLLPNIMVGPAGEWSRGSPDFMQKMIDNGIDVRQLPTNVDKRGLGKGEMAVQITKTHMQAIMLSTRFEQSDGITPGGNDFLLGNSRKKTVSNGVRSIVISQCAKITELWEEYKVNRSGKRNPTHPYPYNDDHPDLNDQMQAIDVNKDESDAVLRDGQYRYRPIE